jgi:hypothetical protein
MADHFEYNYPGPERPERQGDRFKTGLVMGLLGGVVVGFVIGLLAAGHPAFDEQTPILLPMAVMSMVILVFRQVSIAERAGRLIGRGEPDCSRYPRR